MKKNVKKILSLILALVMLLSLAACAKKETPVVEQPQSGNKHVENLVIGTTKKIDKFNITQQGNGFGNFNYNGVIDGMWIYVDENGELAPYFMTSYKISEDGKVLDFTFPTDAIWGDGKPVTADDVVFTFDFMKNTMKQSSLATLVSCEITGEGSARLTFSEPKAYQYLWNGMYNDGCMPKHIWEKMVGSEDYGSWGDPEAAIGCGPYKLDSYDIDAGIVNYVAIPENNYHGDITVDSITVKYYADQTAILMALKKGDIDCYWQYSSPIDATLMELVAGDENIEMGESYYSGNNQITFGMTREACSDFVMRQAILKSFNWELLVSVQGGSTAEIPTTNIISPSCRGFVKTYPKFAQDIEGAKKLLDEAGYVDKNGDGYREYPDGRELDILVLPQYSASMEMRNRMAEVMIDSMKAVGIKAHVDPSLTTSSQVWNENVTAGNYDIFIGYTTSGMARGLSTAFTYFRANYTGSGTGWYYGSYMDEDFNKTIAAMTGATDADEFIKNIEKLQSIADETLFGASLGWTKSFFPYRTDKYEGWQNWASWGVINNNTWTTLTAK